MGEIDEFEKKIKNIPFVIDIVIHSKVKYLACFNFYKYENEKYKSFYYDLFDINTKEFIKSTRYVHLYPCNESNFINIKKDEQLKL